jgi:hypothetical protein
MHSRLCSLAALLLLCLAACSSPPSQPIGSVQFAASTLALSSSDITRLKVTVSSTDMSPLVVELAKSNGSWGGLIGNIPAGSNRSFLAEAFDSSNTKRFQGQTSGVTISANQTTAVAVTLQELVPPPPYANEAPVIDSLVASSTSVQTGASLSLTASVHDPNAGDTLTLAWTASGGSFSAPTAAATSWTAPSSTGVQTLTFTVTDSQGAAVSVSLVVNVVSGNAAGNAAVNISFNLFPTVSRVSASLNRLDAGQSTAVSATASDADADPLSYQWTASCPGTWTNATSSAASFVPSSVPAGVCNNCQLTVTVQDGRGGQNTGSLSLCITPASTHRFAPLVTNFYQSATSTSPGQTITFDVTAMDPQSSSLTFAWTTSTGSLATAQNTASTSHIVWTAPSCASSVITITATVSNAYGLSASQAFSLSGLPACQATWSSTAAMSAGRSLATATLLPSGNVLVTGDYTGTLASAEVYNPSTRSWSSVAPMATGRGQHTATLLNSGKVLVTGGSNGGGTASAELYDPATNSWSSAGSMSIGRSAHTATLLNSGKVLVTGGYRSGVAADLYDPATGSWSSAGSMASSRHYHTATLLPSGKVLVVGDTAAAELYDPATNSWSSAGSMAVSHALHTATLLNSGKVLVVGGTTAAADLYDPATNSWSSATPMAGARNHHTATLLSSGKVLITGGFLSNTSPLSSTELYDPATNSWSSAGSLAVSRGFHTATLLNSGQVLIAAGSPNGYGSVAISSVELYTP